jgi:hypothetical protein
MKLYLKLLVFSTLSIAFGQAVFADTVVISDCSNSKSNTEFEISSLNEKFSSSPFNNRFVFGNENTINTVVEINYLIIKDKLIRNNHHVVYNKYKFYLQQNILASDNNSHYKKLFYKLRILQI